MLFLLLLLIGVGSASGRLHNLARDREALLSMIRHSGLGRGEMRLRTVLLRGAERVVRRHNANPRRVFSMALNKFALMTRQEKELHLGIENGTIASALPAPPSLSAGIPTAANSEKMIIDHRELGHVTPVKQQGNCGSCWALSATAAFEGSYAIATGILKSFSAKELLDCSYEGGSRDGCRGGYPTRAFKYIKKTGRLATARDIPYEPYDGPCSRWDGKENGIKNAMFVGHYKSTDVAKTLMSFTPVTIFTAQDDLFSYSEGIYTGCAKKQPPNHGCIMTGFAADFWEIKNSWGEDWGTGGYFRVSRVGDVCGVMSRVYYPAVVYQDRGEDDRADGDEEGLELRDVAAGRLARLTPGDRVTEGTDGDSTTCFSVGPAQEPSVVISLGETVPVSRVEIEIQGDGSGLNGSKIHIGSSGNFLDKRVAVLGDPDEGGDLFTVTVDPPVQGSMFYWEIYGEGTLGACEIRVLTTASLPDNNTDDCGGGLTRCPDGVCRHLHMC